MLEFAGSQDREGQAPGVRKMVEELADQYQDHPQLISKGPVTYPDDLRSSGR